MAVGLSGLASNMDTDTIVTQLMSIERRGQTRLKLADLKAASRQDTLKDIAAKLTALRTATATLRSSATWADRQSVTSTDSARVAVRALEGGVAPGDHTVGVTSLAVSAQRAFTVGAAGGTLTIGAYGLTVDPGTDAAGIAALLNADDDAPVTAVVAGGSLVLTARSTGAAGDFTAGAAGLLTEQPAYARSGADAVYTLDGVAKTSPSNVLTDAVLGLEITLKAPTASAAVVGAGPPGPDGATIKGAIKAVVDAYNAAQDLMRGELAEKRVSVPQSNFDALQGLFAGDALLAGAVSAMRSALGDLSDLGISTGAVSGTSAFSKDAVAGRLVVDDTKLGAALAADPAAVRERLAGATGLGARLSDAVTPIAGERIDARLESVAAERKRLAGTLTSTDTRLAGREKHLRGRFAAMETALANSQAQLSWLQGQLGVLSA